MPPTPEVGSCSFSSAPLIDPQVWLYVIPLRLQGPVLGDLSFLVLYSRLPLLGGASAYCGCSYVCPLEKRLLPDVKMMHYGPLESESDPCALELGKSVGQESIKDR